MTSADLIDVPAAAAGTRTRIHFQGRFTEPEDAGLALPAVPGAARRPRDRRAATTSSPTTPDSGFSTNVVDIGIFDPSGKGLGNADGFRGWSGGARRHFRLSHRWATPGYLAGPITPGRWHVILGPFLITPPGTPWHVTVTLEHGPRAEPAFQAHHAPVAVPGTGPGWYRGDLHTHSVHSDGHWTPAQLVAQAQANGLDFLGTSDHNTNAATRVFGQHRPRRLPGGQRRGGDDPQRPLARDRDDARHLGRLALPRRRPQARAASPTSRAAAVASRSRPTRSCRSPAPAGTSARRGARSTRSRCGTDRGSFFNQLTLDAWQQQLVAGGYTPAVGNSDSHHDGQVVGLPADGLPPRHPVERGDRGRGAGRPLLDRRVVGRRPDLRGPRHGHHDQHRRVGRHRGPRRRRAAGLPSRRDRRTRHGRSADRHQRGARGGRRGRHRPPRARRDRRVRVRARRGTPSRHAAGRPHGRPVERADGRAHQSDLLRSPRQSSGA